MVQPLTVHGIKDRIKATFEVAEGLAPDDEVQSHLARYLCILSAGFIEEALRIILSAYARKRCDPRCRSFVEKHLDRAPNPKPANIAELLGKFDSDWKKGVEEFFTSQDGDGAIGSLIANRHLIAHGRDSQVTLRRVRDWHVVAVRVIDHIQECVGT